MRRRCAAPKHATPRQSTLPPSVPTQPPQPPPKPDRLCLTLEVAVWCRQASHRSAVEEKETALAAAHGVELEAVRGSLLDQMAAQTKE